MEHKLVNFIYNSALTIYNWFVDYLDAWKQSWYILIPITIIFTSLLFWLDCKWGYSYRKFGG